MKQLTQAQLVLAVVFGLASMQASAGDTPNSDAPISSIQDWSSRSVIHRKPMFPEEFLRVGEMEALYKDPRYVASVLRRVELELPRSTQRQRAASFKSAQAPCTDRRRGHCPNTPEPEPVADGATLRDWSNVLGGGVDGQGGNGIQGMFPAKYNFDIFAPASCANDFVVYPTNAAGATQSGTRQEQWSGAVTTSSTNNQTITIGLAGRRQVVLRARTTTLQNNRDFLVGATNNSAAQNLRDAINFWTGETGFRATLTAGNTVTIVSDSAGDINNTSVVSDLTGYAPANSLPGTGTTTPGQPTIIAFNQLYNTTCNATRINANAPNVLWSYNTGDGYIAETSPVLSYLDNGKQVAFVQRNGNSLQLVVLKPGGGSGSTGAPTAPVFVTNANYRACSNNGGCFTTISFSTAVGANNNSAGGQTWSAPFVDYGTDTLWAGDGNGILHKFNGVFVGTPSEATSGGFPKVVELGQKLSPPVYAGGNVYIGSQSGSGTVGGKLHRVDAANGNLFSSVKLAVADSTGIRESVIVDNFTDSVFAFLFNDGTAGNSTDCAPTDPDAGNFDACRTVARFAEGFGNTAAPLQRAYVGRGNSRVSALYAGGFDDAYYNSVDATGAMYIVGGNPTQTYTPTLWKIPLTAGVMGAPQIGAVVGDNLGCGAQPNCSNAVLDMSPVTVIKNPDTGLERIFFSLPKDATADGCTGACLYMYPLNQSVTTGTNKSETWTLRIARGTSTGGVRQGIPATGAGSLTINLIPVVFSSAGSRSGDRTALIAGINAVSGYSAAPLNTCSNTGANGSECDLVITRAAFGDVAASTVTNALTNVTQTANVNGSVTSTSAQDIAWGTGNTPGAALPVFSGTSGIIIDNVRPSADAGTSQIYFAQLDTALRERWTMTFASANNTNTGTFTVNGVTFTGNTSATSCTSIGGNFNMSGDAKSDAGELRACLRSANLPGFTIAGENGATDGSVVVAYTLKGNVADTLVQEAVAGAGNVIVITQGTASTAGNAIQVSQSGLQ